MNNAARKVALWLVLTLPVTIALGFSSAFSASFSAPKNALLVGTTFALAALALIFQPRWRRPREEWPLWLAAAAFVGLNLLSAAHSQRPLPALKSAELPVCGMLLFAVALLALSGERSALNIRNLQVSIAAASVLVSLVAVAQFFGVDFPGPLHPVDSPHNRLRMYATLGNPDFVATFLAVALPPAIGLSLAAQRSRALWTSASVLIAVGLLLTGSRGGVLAGAVALIGLAFALRRTRVTILIAVGFACALAAGTQLNARTPLESLRGRVFIWQVSLDRQAEQSALGSGPGSFAYKYPARLGQFFSIPGREALLRFAGRELHAQNDFVEAWHDTGWLGASSLLLLLAAWFQIALRKLRASSVEAKTAIAAAIASLAALSVAALFDFPMHRAETWALLGLSMAVPLVSSAPANAHLGRSSWPTYAGTAGFLVIGSYLSAAPLVASYEIAKGESEETADQIDSSQSAYRTALQWDPSSPDANYDLVRALAKAGDYSGALVQSGIATSYINEPEFYILRSRILQNADRQSDARHELEEAKRRFPYSNEVRAEIASIPLPASE